MPKPNASLLLLLVVCAGAALTSATAQEHWRSRLYPTDWTPTHADAAGRFLHDFSYAGYGNGEAPPPPDATRLTVDACSDFGADNTATEDATAPVQAAIDAVEGRGGGVVLLPAGLYRCDGVLVVDGSGVVLRGMGPAATRLQFTRTAKMAWKAHITFRGKLRHGAAVPLAADAPNRAVTVQVNDAGIFAPGDDVCIGWTITDAFVAEHNMTGTWKAFNGKWRPFFRRRIAAIDMQQTPHTVTFDVPLRYAARLRDGASIRKETGHLTECGLEQLGVSSAVARKQAWSQNGVRTILVQGAKDCWVRGIHSFPSPLPEAKGHHLQNGGIRVLDSKRVTVAECRMARAQNRGGGGCGYLFEISRSNEVLTVDCVAEHGRHNFIQNWDFGTTGCVWLRCTSTGSRALHARIDPIGTPAFSEYHHSLAMACLVDQCTLNDGWYCGNRRDWSSGAGTTATQCVFWNTNGRGKVGSWQAGMGYVIGTRDVGVRTGLRGRWAKGSAPEDYVEGREQGGTLLPQSLYEDQRRRRLPREAR